MAKIVGQIVKSQEVPIPSNYNEGPHVSMHVSKYNAVKREMSGLKRVQQQFCNAHRVL